MLRRDQPKENTMLIRSHHSGFIHPHSSEITPQPLYLRRREFLQWTAAGSMAAASGHRTCPKRAAGNAACCYQHFAHDTARSTGQPSGRHSPSAQKRQIDSA